MNEAMLQERLRQFEDNHRAGTRALRENQEKQDQLKNTLQRIRGALEALRGLDDTGVDMALVAARIRSFEEELPRGEEQLNKLERSRQEIANTMMRIEGAITVVKEMLEEQRAQSTGPESGDA